jgi:hypothetical protein
MDMKRSCVKNAGSIHRSWISCVLRIQPRQYLANTETTLTPPTHRWPDWHISLHRISVQSNSTSLPLSAVEGGFAISNADSLSEKGLRNVDEPAIITQTSQNTSFIMSKKGASGVAAMVLNRHGVNVRGELIRPDPNTNLMVTRTMLPTLRYGLFLSPGKPLHIAMAVFAIAPCRDWDSQSVLKRWSDQPSLQLKEGRFSV